MVTDIFHINKKQAIEKTTTYRLPLTEMADKCSAAQVAAQLRPLLSGRSLGKKGLVQRIGFKLQEPRMFGVFVEPKNRVLQTSTGRIFASRT